MKDAIQKARILPTLDDLIADDDVIDKRNKANDLMVLLNQDPPEHWVVAHPYIKNYRYLPISKVEYLLKKIFVNYRIEVLREGQLFNSIMCAVRVHYLDPITNQWSYHDGVGAQELQTVKDTGSLKSDMSNVNKSAVQMALPISKSIAVKDACDHFGKLFGSDLNRKDYIDYNNLLSEKKYSKYLELSDKNLSDKNAIKLLKSSKNLTNLLENWQSLSIEEKNMISVVAVKDEMKGKLS